MTKDKKEALDAWLDSLPYPPYKHAGLGDAFVAGYQARQHEIDELVELEQQAYWERNRLVAILARLYPSGRFVTNIQGWDAEWHNCIYIDLPTGQASWHIHDDEMVQFASLPEYKGEWDGHTTCEKYRRLLLLLLKLEVK